MGKRAIHHACQRDAMNVSINNLYHVEGWVKVHTIDVNDMHYEFGGGAECHGFVLPVGGIILRHDKGHTTIVELLRWFVIRSCHY